jgi:hypothetical protein
MISFLAITPDICTISSPFIVLDDGAGQCLSKQADGETTEYYKGWSGISGNT